MEKAVEMALANSKQVMTAESDIVIANEGLKQASRASSIGVSLTHRSSSTRNYAANREDRSYANAITAAYPIYTGGRIKSGIEAANIELEIKRMSLSRVIQDVRLSVFVGIYSILRAEDMVRSHEESLQRLRAHFDNVLIQYENGKVSRADLLRSEVEALQEEQTLISARNTLDTAVKQLNSALGVPLGTKLVAEETLSHKKFGRSLEECIEYAMQNRPDLKSAMLEVEWARAGVNLAKSEKAPQAALSVTQNLNSYANWPGFKQGDFSITLEIDYRILDSGIANSKIASAKEAAAKAVSGYEQVKEALELDVTSYFLSMQEAEKRILESQTAIDKAMEAYEIAQARYSEGVGTNIDVMDSQGVLTLANSNHIQAMCDYNISLARLENAMGDDFSNMNRAKRQ